MDNILDLLVSIQSMEEAKEIDVAPMELMTQFLIFISKGNMVHALELASEILVYEPNNSMIMEYEKSLKALTRQLEGNENHRIINQFFFRSMFTSRLSTKIAILPDDSSESEEFLSESSVGDSGYEESYSSFESESEDCDSVDQADSK